MKAHSNNFENKKFIIISIKSNIFFYYRILVMGVLFLKSMLHSILEVLITSYAQQCNNSYNVFEQSLLTLPHQPPTAFLRMLL